MFIFLRKIFLHRKYALLWTAIACLILTVVSFLINGGLKPLEGFFLSKRLLYALLCVIRTILRAVYALPFVCVGFLLFETGKALGGKKEDSFSRAVRGRDRFVCFGDSDQCGKRLF